MLAAIGVPDMYPVLVLNTSPNEFSNGAILYANPPYPRLVATMGWNPCEGVIWLYCVSPLVETATANVIGGGKTVRLNVAVDLLV